MAEEGAARPPAIFDRAFLTDVEDVIELVFVRHGEQLRGDPRAETPADWVDPPLSERGVRQAQLVGERFSIEKVDAVYSSPLRRAHETALQVARHHRLEAVVMPDLREVEVYRDVPVDSTPTKFLGRALVAAVRERMIYERDWDVYPHSEPGRDFRKRVVNAVEAIIAENAGRRVVVACHGGVINAYIAHVIGTRSDMFFRPGHTSVSIVRAGEGIRAVHSLNDMHHLLTANGSFVSH